MLRTLCTLITGISLGVGGMTLIHNEGAERVKPIASLDIKEKLEGKEAKASVVEVSIEPGQSGAPHRHPGPVFGYVLEGQYELGLDAQAAKILKQGDAFYEPAGCLHRVSKNPALMGKTRVLAWVIHPRDAKHVAIPEIPETDQK